MLDDNANDEILAEFVSESRETLDRVEPLLISLEQGGGSPDAETLAVIFRCFHSFKGTASFIGLNVTSSLAHSAESLLDLYRKGSSVQPHHLTVLCQTLDLLRLILEVVEADQTDASKAEPGARLSRQLDEIVQSIKGLGPSPGSAKGVINPPPQVAPRLVTISLTDTEAPAGGRPEPLQPMTSQSVPPEMDEMMRMLTAELMPKFVAEAEEHLTLVEATLVSLESRTAGAEQIAQAFRAMHSLKGNCGICGLPQLEELTHGAETLLGRVQQHPALADVGVVSLLLEVVDVSRRALSKVLSGDHHVPGKDKLLARLSLATTGQGTASPQQPMVVPFQPQGGTQMPPPPGNESGVKDETKASAKAPETSIRVDTEKLDLLMNLVGELIIAETTVTKNPDLDGYEFENFQKAALNLNRLTRSLQEIAMAVRMVPIAATFRKMVRLVRDVSMKQSKKVELVSTGEDTEVDKTVVESISDPLVHLIRNAVDHGLESAEERLANGKSATGHVWLNARHQGGEVWITLRDDGRGLDPKKILAKAIEKKLADPNREYSEREITDFIFAAGFSTAAAVTDISGRGVGMDVVRRNIEGVGGRIETLTQVGVGTTFTLRIPLTLAIIEGMLVRVGASYYTIPLLSIRESVKANRADITLTADGAELMSLRKRFLPVVRIHLIHDIPDAQRNVEDGILMIVEAGGKTVCLLVDDVIGQRQTVIKSLPDYLKRIRGVSGCSILHNGEISLILDLEGILGSTQKSHAA